MQPFYEEEHIDIICINVFSQKKLLKNVGFVLKNSKTVEIRVFVFFRSMTTCELKSAKKTLQIYNKFMTMVIIVWFQIWTFFRENPVLTTTKNNLERLMVHTELDEPHDEPFKQY